MANFFRKHNMRAQVDTAPSKHDDSCENDADDMADGWMEQPREQQATAGVEQLIDRAPPVILHRLNWHQFRLFLGLKASAKLNRVVANAFSLWRVVLHGAGSDLFLSIILSCIEPRRVCALAASSKFWLGAANRVMHASGFRKLSFATKLTDLAQPGDSLSQASSTVVKKRNKFKSPEFLIR